MRKDGIRELRLGDGRDLPPTAVGGAVLSGDEDSNINALFQCHLPVARHAETIGGGGA